MYSCLVKRHKLIVYKGALFLACGKHDVNMTCNPSLKFTASVFSHIIFLVTKMYMKFNT